MDGIENWKTNSRSQKAKRTDAGTGGSSTQYFSGSSVQVGDGYDISGYYNPKPTGKAFGRECGCSAGLSGADDGRRMYEADGESGYTVFDKKLGRRTAVL